MPSPIRRRPLVALAVFAILVGCAADRQGTDDANLVKPDTGGGDGTSSGAPPTDAAYIATRFSLFGQGGGGPAALHTASFSAGQTQTATLESLKYFIRSIQICEDVETQGTGTGKATNCLEIYKGPPDGPYQYSLDPNADYTSLADTARGSDDGFVDLMDPPARAKLGANTRLRPEDAHAYNYGLVYWELPIKVKASMPSLADGPTFYTHDGATVRTEMPNGGFVSYPTVSSAALTTGPAEEAVILHPNGGTWIKFQHPLVVTKADIDDKQSYVLDLTFDPAGLVKGFTFGGPPPSIVGPGDTPDTISVPMLDLTPVPHRASETVVRETYVATVQGGGDDFDVRLELYSIGEDPNRTIYGASATTLLNARSSTYFSDFSKIAFLDSKGDGTIDFQIYDHSPVVSGFTRGAAVGDTTTASLDCQGPSGPDRHGAFGVAFDGCASTPMAVTFTLTDIQTLAPVTPPSLDFDGGVTESDAGDASP